MSLQLDHLVYATPNLEATVDDIERHWGVRPEFGGRHPGGGTWNALLSFGGGSYLEVIGPDPEQPAPERERPFGIDHLRAPRLVTWAVKAPDIAATVRSAREQDYDPGDPTPMSRDRPDGVHLAWTLTRPPDNIGDGLVPFLIDWGETEHPSTVAPGGCSFVSMRAEHLDPARVQRLLAALGVELEVAQGPAPALFATIDTPNGRQELR